MQDHRAGPKPVKATNSLTLSWNLVTLPLSIYAGLDDGTTVKRNEFTVDGHPIGRQKYDKTTGLTYDGDVEYKVEVAPDQYVSLSDEEKELVTGGVIKGRSEIECFVPLDAIGREYLVSDVKQVRPHAKTPGSDKPFVLLCDTMRDAEVGALIRVTLRSVTQYGIITPDGDLLLLHYADEVRPPRDMPVLSAKDEITDKERAMAHTLLHDVVGINTPVLVNDNGIKLMQYVAQKAEGGDVLVAETADAPTSGDSLEALLAAAVEAARTAKADEAAAAAA
jgi:non-homologous end joining protein Ku